MNNYGVHVAGTDHDGDGIWRTIEGEPLPWLEFHGGEPNSIEHTCMELRATRTGLSDLNCNYSRFAVCERSAFDVNVSACRTEDSDGSLHCYFALEHLRPVDARSACPAECVLATIESRAEFAFVHNFVFNGNLNDLKNVIR